MPSKYSLTNPVTVTTRELGYNRVCSFGDCRGPGEYSNVLYQAQVYTVESSRTWTRTSNFRALKKEGKLPMNPFNRATLVESVGGALVTNPEVYQWADSVGNSVHTRRQIQQSVRTLYAPDPVNTLVDFESLNTKLVNKIKNADWQAPVFVAEARKTADMVLQTASSLRKVIQNLRRGNILPVFNELGLTENKRLRKRYNATYVKDPSKAASNAWLQLQYGWVPLLSDAESAAKALASYVDDERHKTLTVRCAQKRDQYRTATFPFAGQPCGNGELYFDVKDSDSVRYLVHYRVNEDLRALGQLGILNPLAVVWELVPFSFVADWFIPIGDYISALDVGMRYQFVNGLMSRKRMSVGTLSEFKCDNASLEGGNPSWTRSDIYAQRMGSIPTPSVESLTFKADLSPKRLASGISLLRQQASRLVRK